MLGTETKTILGGSLPGKWPLWGKIRYLTCILGEEGAYPFVSSAMENNQEMKTTVCMITFSILIFHRLAIFAHLFSFSTLKYSYIEFSK